MVSLTISGFAGGFLEGVSLLLLALYIEDNIKVFYMILLVPSIDH